MNFIKKSNKKMMYIIFYSMFLQNNFIKIKLAELDYKFAGEK